MYHLIQLCVSWLKSTITSTFQYLKEIITVFIHYSNNVDPRILIGKNSR